MPRAKRGLTRVPQAHPMHPDRRAEKGFGGPLRPDPNLVPDPEQYKLDDARRAKKAGEHKPRPDLC